MNLPAKNRRRGIAAEHRTKRWLREHGAPDAWRVPMSGAGAIDGDLRVGVLVLDLKYTKAASYRVTREQLLKVASWSQAGHVGGLLIQFAGHRERWVVFDLEDVLDKFLPPDEDEAEGA